MRLSGRQVEQIHEALLDAFASRDALRMLVRIELEEDLEAIAGGDNLRVVVFNLVNWSEQTGRVSQLIQGAYRQNQGNVKLQALVEDAQEWFAPPPSPPASPEAPLRRPDARSVPASIDVFLSYSRKDEAIMRQVQDSLRAAGLSVWIDEGLEPGTVGWQEAIAEAIDQAQVMVVLLSPASNQSLWVRKEISFAQSRGKRICPVLVAGSTERSVPIGLIDVQWVDGREDLRRALDQQLLPSLQRTPGSPDDRVPTVEAESVIRETAGRKRVPAWIVMTAAAIVVGAGAYYVVGRLQYPPSQPVGTPAAVATTPASASTTNSTGVAADTPVPATNTVANTPVPVATQSPTATKPSASEAGDVRIIPIEGTRYFIMPAGLSITAVVVADTPAPAIIPLPNIPVPVAMQSPTATKPTAPEAGDIWINPKDGAEYVFIPSGTFMMGSAADDQLAEDDERPQHPVTLDGYWILRTEVTNGQYKQCVDDGACTPPGNSEYAMEGFELRPVTHVDWHQASAYAVWAGGRLPTEAEWEYACRGGDGRLYPWGIEEPSPDRLNFHGSGLSTWTDVGSYPAGANGLYDMAGNVWEWTSSKSESYPYRADDGRESPEDYYERVLRGGSFSYSGYGVRCALRLGWDSDYWLDSGGFRVMSPGS